MVSAGALTLGIISASGCMITPMTSGPSTKPPQRSILQDSSRSVQRSMLHFIKGSMLPIQKPVAAQSFGVGLSGNINCAQVLFTWPSDALQCFLDWEILSSFQSKYPHLVVKRVNVPWRILQCFGPSGELNNLGFKKNCKYKTPSFTTLFLTSFEKYN